MVRLNGKVPHESAVFSSAKNRRKRLWLEDAARESAPSDRGVVVCSGRGAANGPNLPRFGGVLAAFWKETTKKTTRKTNLMVRRLLGVQTSTQKLF